ncbi:MAG: glutamine synthetase III [Desulfovibrio sp.]|nr:glutamine synthetase III [Desulfovibrio sp.]
MLSPRFQAVSQAMATQARRAATENERGLLADKIFGMNVFGLDEMRRRLPKNVFEELEQTMEEGHRLNPAIADVVANAMKDWAIEHQATHYTHWFQPMTGLTAEKHDAFLTPSQKGHVISSFSGKMLISSEPDASSFPSGGLRSTFEARGYTAWDPTVPVFIIDEPYGATLHIPSFFFAFSGEALDRKIPLERSIEVLSKAALRILRLFGNTEAHFVHPMVGAEQEYFLVDSHLAALRPDLLLCGRTLLGAPAAKGQEMEDHYFGAIPERVLAFMQDLEHELLKLGIPCKTRHNEVAPGQFELAPVFEEANMACDHNMLTMNMMRHIAPRHGFLCLLHEKPFAGVNGSGKHNNWSLVDSQGQNLLNPGKTPKDNAQFLVFLAAVLAAVHKHSPLLRLGTIGAGNDHRLGANEAPPAILSVYVGEELNDVIEGIIDPAYARHENKKPMEIGVSSLPALPVDQSDRNRTSPFAFTGNKFEFRAVGSSQSIAPANIALNAAVAASLDEIANTLEAAVASGKTITTALQELLPETFSRHKDILFNGNGYTQEWVEEAKRRGLPNDDNTVSALDRYNDPQVTQVFVSQGIFSEREMQARQEILYANYAKTLIIEGQQLLELGKTRVLPVANGALDQAATRLQHLTETLGKDACQQEQLELTELHGKVQALRQSLKDLVAALAASRAEAEARRQAKVAKQHLLPAMQAVRACCDKLEEDLEDSSWPLPKYSELLWIH